VSRNFISTRIGRRPGKEKRASVDARARQKDFAMQDIPQRADAHKKTRTLAPPTGRASKSDLPQDTDGLPPITHAKLAKMETAFVSATRKAIASGSERDRGRR
jgi:hypothetical protein